MNELTFQTNQALADLSENLGDALNCLLPEKPEGWAEHELIKALCAPPYSLFPPNCLAHSYSLFRTHFALFHALYKLRDELHEDRLGHLEISALSIRLHGYSEGANAVEEIDKLREYYLDWRNLTDTRPSDVEALLDDFWNRFTARSVADTDVDQALKELELDKHAELTLSAIRRQYRRLAMKHHPDRGGDADKFKSIYQAMVILSKSTWASEVPASED